MKMLNRNKAWINFMVCMLTLTALTFNACKEEEDGIRIPDEDEILTKHIPLEVEDYYIKIIRFDMWGQNGEFQNIEVIPMMLNDEYGNSYLSLDFENIDEKPHSTAYFQKYILDKTDLPLLQNYNKENITINGAYKYVYSEWILDAPYKGDNQYSIEKAYDCFELKVYDIKP